MDQEALIRKYLSQHEYRYHPDLGMLSGTVDETVNRYHSGLAVGTTVHIVRESFEYALGLLIRDEGDDRKTAAAALNRLIDLQDSDPASPTCGIWSWFYEEPLDQMVRPDFNWADFNGKLLLLIAQYHGSKLSQTVNDRIRESVRLCCQSIIRRDVTITYTNIAIMDCLVTILAGEIYGMADAFSYGTGKLDRFYRYTMDLQNFPEYNSPTYTLVAIDELSAIVSCCQDGSARQKSRAILDLAWRMVAIHHHVPTRQWGGPHGRCYHTLIGGSNRKTDKGCTFVKNPDTVLSGIQIGLGSKATIIDPDRMAYRPAWYHVMFDCPDQYVTYFTRPDTYAMQEVVEKGDGYAIRAAFYNSPEVFAGSFDKNIMWDHNRALIWYFTHGSDPTYLHIQFKHNQYGFCSAALTSAMHEEQCVFGIDFATDYGARFLAADASDGVFTARFFCLRAEIGGDLSGVCYDADPRKREVSLVLGARRYRLSLLHVELDDLACTLETSEHDGKILIDFVLYRGPERNFDFKTIARASILASMLREDEAAPEISLTEDRAAISAGPLAVSILRQPSPLTVLYRQNTTRNQ